MGTILNCVLKEVNTLSGERTGVDLEEMPLVLGGRAESVGWGSNV